MRAVVITGASTGIGRACAHTLDARGFDVFAGVRRHEDGEALRRAASERMTPVHLDVTDEESIATAVTFVAERTGTRGLAGLVNNAGATVPCPVQYLPLAQFRQLLEVNLTGHLAVVQAFLPLLRRAPGRIVNVTSMAGKVGLPMMASYTVAKHGMEGLSDVLRLELARYDIGVSVVEPGLIATDMGGKLQRDAEAVVRALPAEGRTAYGTTLAAMAEHMARESAAGSPPDVVAEAVAHALTATRARTRYPVGSGAKRMLRLRRMLPDRWLDRLVLRAVGATGPQPPERTTNVPR